MNESAVKRAIKAFIRSHEDELVDDLEVRGAAGLKEKKIARIVTAEGAWPVTAAETIFIAVNCITAQEWFDGTQLGSSVRYERLVDLTPIAEYLIELIVYDNAVKQEGEQVGAEYEPFETEIEVFDTFISRLVDMFRKYPTIPPVSGSYTIEVLNDGSRDAGRFQLRDYSQTRRGGGNTTVYSPVKTVRFTARTCGEPRALSRP